MFETIDMTRYLIACGLLFGLLAALYFSVLLWQRYRANGHFTPAKRRLKIVETLALNARHKLYIIRQDGIDHTILVGGSADIHLGSMSAPQEETTATAKENMTPTDPNAKYTIGFLKDIGQEKKVNPKAKSAKKKPNKK